MTMRASTRWASDKSGELSQFFEGVLDEVHVFSRSMTATEVEALHDVVDCSRSGLSVFEDIVTATDNATLAWATAADIVRRRPCGRWQAGPGQQPWRDDHLPVP